MYEFTPLTLHIRSSQDCLLQVLAGNGDPVAVVERRIEAAFPAWAIALPFVVMA